VRARVQHRGRVLSPLQRVAARWTTGPLAHFYAGVADWATLAARYARARASGRRID
jgi:hypothetical protein